MLLIKVMHDSFLWVLPDWLSFSIQILCFYNCCSQPFRPVNFLHSKNWNIIVYFVYAANLWLIRTRGHQQKPNQTWFNRIDGYALDMCGVLVTLKTRLHLTTGIVGHGLTQGYETYSDMTLFLYNHIVRYYRALKSLGQSLRPWFKAKRSLLPFWYEVQLSHGVAVPFYRQLSS